MAKTFAMPLPMTMLMLRCRCQDFQMDSIKTCFVCCFLIIELNENFFMQRLQKTSSIEATAQITGPRLQYKLERKKWRNKVSALVFFIIRQKFIYIVDKLLNKNRCEKIDEHVVLSFVFPTKTLLNKRLLNTVK